jgi:hypothetical protein
VPAALFADIEGVPAEKMFYNTFAGCANLSGNLPAGLFGGIYGAPAIQMFNRTFYNCAKLTGLDGEIFGKIEGSAQSGMFSEMFYRAYDLTGPSATIDGVYLYDIWPSATNAQVGSMYKDDTKLDDYANIPSVWGGL